MSIIKDSITQIKSVATILSIVYSVLLVLFIAIALISLQFGIGIDQFTRDPAGLLNVNPFTGVISNIGILFWCATSVLCFFTAFIHWKNKSIKVATFLFYSGLITAVLLFDDLFMFHETVFPEILHIPEKLVYVAYFVLVLVYFIKFSQDLLKTDYIILFFACNFFALSIVCDTFFVQEGMEFLIEDGFKLFGIISWFIFYSRTCFAQMWKMIDE